LLLLPFAITTTIIIISVAMPHERKQMDEYNPVINYEINVKNSSFSSFHCCCCSATSSWRAYNDFFPPTFSFSLKKEIPSFSFTFNVNDQKKFFTRKFWLSEKKGERE
jgi:hypothetical protein